MTSRSHKRSHKRRSRTHKRNHAPQEGRAQKDHEKASFPPPSLVFCAIFI